MTLVMFKNESVNLSMRKEVTTLFSLPENMKSLVITHNLMNQQEQQSKLLKCVVKFFQCAFKHALMCFFLHKIKKQKNENFKNTYVVYTV